MVTVSLSFRRSGRDSLCEFLTTQQLIMTLHSVPLQFKKSIKALTLFLILISIRPNLGMLIPNRTSRNTTLETDSAPFLSSGKGNGTESNREGRMSVVSGGLFTLISFQNVPCNATSGDVGICYSNRECANLGGIASGKCAGNYGVCCLVTASCGASVTLNNTYFVNPSYPSTDSGPLACSITVTKLPRATQLYLEFSSFSLVGPTLGACTNDSFTVTVGGGNTITETSYPVLCGTVAPDTMEYIDLSTATGPIRLSVALGSTPGTRSWKIRLVQFKPGDFCAAPRGCNEYYRSVGGTLESFNFNKGQGELLNDYCTQICFQNQVGYCSLLLTETNFMLSGIAPDECTDDYFLINGKRFCGDTLNNGMVQVNQTSPGGLISFLFCSGSSNLDMDLGYSLTYNFLPCGTNRRG